MTLKIFGFIFFLASSFYAQSQNSENSVYVIPHWKKDEMHSVKIKTTTIDTNVDNSKAQIFISTFDAKFIVADVFDSGYKVEWAYTGSKLANNEPVLESQIVAKLINVKMIIKLSNVGKFVELVNVNDIKIAAEKALDTLIANNTSNPIMNAQFKTAKQLISSQQGLEIALLKQIKFYNFSFGYNYELNNVQTNNIKFPNPFGGQPFDAIEKVQLTKLDKTSCTCVIETSKTIDGNAVKSAVTDYVKKVSNVDPKTINEQVDKANCEISESTMQKLDYSKGIVQKSFFKRTVNLGFQNRTTNLEIETVN